MLYHTIFATKNNTIEIQMQTRFLLKFKYFPSCWLIITKSSWSPFQNDCKQFKLVPQKIIKTDKMYLQKRLERKSKNVFDHKGGVL